VRTYIFRSLAKQVLVFWGSYWQFRLDIVVDCQKFAISKSHSLVKLFIRIFHCNPSRGRVQGLRPPPPRDEDFFFVFAFKICLPHHSVAPFLSGAPSPKKNPGSAPDIRNLLDLAWLTRFLNVEILKWEISASRFLNH